MTLDTMERGFDQANNDEKVEQKIEIRKKAVRDISTDKEIIERSACQRRS